MSRSTITITRRPGRAMAAGAAALVLALSACGGSDEPVDQPAEEAPAAQEPSDQGGDAAHEDDQDGASDAGGEETGAADGEDDSGEGDAEEPSTTDGEDGNGEGDAQDTGEGDGSDGGDEAAAPSATFEVVSLAPMGDEDGPDVEVPPEALAETAAQMAGVDPADVTCEGRLDSGSGQSVPCTVGSTGEVLTAYPVWGGNGGTEAYQLVVPGELDQATTEKVLDPVVSMQYGPTELFFDDPELVEGEGLADRVRSELDNLGVGEQVETCEGTVGGGDEDASIRCTGHREGDENAAVSIELLPAISGSGDPVSVVLVTGEAS